MFLMDYFDLSGHILSLNMLFHRASVSRVKRMRDIVDKDNAEAFSKAAMHLIEVEDFVELIQEAENIWEKWPQCKSWLEWWIHNSAAKSLFKAQRIMSENAADKIPATTNAQEAMHRYFYMAADSGHSMITGRFFDSAGDQGVDCSKPITKSDTFQG